MVTALLQSKLTLPRADDIGARRQFAIRRAFFDMPICKWIERQRMSFHTGIENGLCTMFLHISEDEYMLLKLKIDDSSILKWIA